MAVHDSKLNTEDPKTEDHRKFKAWAVSSRLAWATESGLFQEKKKI